MNGEIFDIVIVGSGPAGVSAAFPLLEAGLTVLMADGGKTPTVLPPAAPFIDSRRADSDQWKWMVGPDFQALRNLDAVSPKLRVPTHAYAFEDFALRNKVESDGYVVVGSLATGGLSRAWGCGVATLDASELSAFPFAAREMAHSYESVVKRIGVSGSSADDLSAYFGLDAWAQPALPMDDMHARAYSLYELKRNALVALDFRLGRSRVAALSLALGERQACNLSGNCLYGCHSKSLYTASDELEVLARYPNFRHAKGFVVDDVASAEKGVRVFGHLQGVASTLHGKKLVLAAGTIATTRLALRTLKISHRVPLQSCPSAAFLLWAPRFLGRSRRNEFGLGQLSFSLGVEEEIRGFGSTFSTTGIPMTEFVSHLPLRKRYGIDVLRSLLSSCVAGNIFLPGHLSDATAGLDADGSLRITGGYGKRVAPLLAIAHRKLRAAYRKLGLIMMPTSFTVGRPGGDIHYAATLPMRATPVPGQTAASGALAGVDGIYVADGACLSALSEKSHTLTIMANADRIANQLARRMKTAA